MLSYKYLVSPISVPKSSPVRTGVDSEFESAFQSLYELRLRFVVSPKDMDPL